MALETLKEQPTLNEVASLYGVHPVPVAQWTKQALTGLPTVCSTDRSPGPAEVEAQQAPLIECDGFAPAMPQALERVGVRCLLTVSLPLPSAVCQHRAALPSRFRLLSPSPPPMNSAELSAATTRQSRD